MHEEHQMCIPPFVIIFDGQHLPLLKGTLLFLCVYVWLSEAVLHTASACILITYRRNITVLFVLKVSSTFCILKYLRIKWIWYAKFWCASLYVNLLMPRCKCCKRSLKTVTFLLLMCLTWQKCSLGEHMIGGKKIGLLDWWLCW